jgi:hypothetical protein
LICGFFGSIYEFQGTGLPFGAGASGVFPHGAGGTALAAVAPTPDGPDGSPNRLDGGQAELERHLRKTVKEKGIQTELPMYRPEESPKLPDIPKPPISLARAATALAIGGCVVLAFILVAHVRKSRRNRTEAPEKAAPAAARPRSELDAALKGIRDDADALAGKGLFSEAVHALLLKGLDAFRRRDRLKVPPHMTSRELLPALPLNHTEDESLRELVFMTEGAWFGGYPLGKDHYESARESFGRLLGSVSPAAAAALDRARPRPDHASGGAPALQPEASPSPDYAPQPVSASPSNSAPLAGTAHSPDSAPHPGADPSLDSGTRAGTNASLYSAPQPGTSPSADSAFQAETALSSYSAPLTEAGPRAWPQSGASAAPDSSGPAAPGHGHSAPHAAPAPPQLPSAGPSGQADVP